MQLLYAALQEFYMKSKKANFLRCDYTTDDADNLCRVVRLEALALHVPASAVTDSSTSYNIINKFADGQKK